MSAFDVLNNFKRGEPIYVRKPIPTFKTDLEKIKYYEKKYELWRNGDGKLTGMHLYYLDNVKLFNRVTGEETFPICRDIDVVIFHEIERLRKLNKWLYITKARGIGLSTLMFTIPFWYFRMYAGSTCVATTGKDKKTLGRLFSSYTMFAYENMDENIKPPFLNKNETASESFLAVNTKIKTEEGVKYRKSRFECKETSDTPKSPTAFSGYGAIYGAFDELPLHPRRRELIGSAKEIFRNPITKKIEGFLIAGGTVEDSVSGEDLSALKEFVENCEGFNFEHLFIPATWGRCMTNGWSDLEQAEKEILEERKKLESLEDKSVLNNEIKNNPLNLEEIFNLAGSKMIEEDVLDIIKATIEIINNERPPIAPYSLTNMGGRISASPSSSSPITILEHPKRGVEYRIGIDGTGSTKQGGVMTGSDVGLVVTKMFDPEKPESSYTPVAIYTERPKSFEDSYIKMANIIRYYNLDGLCKVQAESNQGNEHFGAYLIKEGLEKTIMMRQDLSGKGFTNKNKMFTFRTPDVINWQYRQANIVLRKYGYNFKFKKLLSELLLPYETNTDILDAWLMCLCGMGADFDKPVVKKRKASMAMPKFNQETGTWED